MGTSVVGRGRREGRGRGKTRLGVAVVALGMAFSTVGLPACLEPPWAIAEEAYHDNYRLDDGSVVFLSRLRNLARFREGDQVLFLARQSAEAFASKRGDRIVVVDGGSRLRLESRTGRTRVGERVELYREEEVRFRNGNVRLAGTLLLPPGPGPHAAVVFAEGAGRTTRHGFGRIFADLFARQGIASLLYDKRGAGDSTGTYGSVVRDYGALAGDVLAGVRMLKSRADIDATRIGVRGTSEGGWVVALAAARSSDIAFVMAISAPARPGHNGVWEMQNKLRDAGVGGDALKAMTLASTQVMSVVRALGLLPECCRHDSFPESDWERVRQPVLLLYGRLDKQVPPALSALTLAEALRRGGNRHHAVRAFPGANHAIMLAKSGFESEMRRATAVRFAPGYLEVMLEWVHARVARQPVAVDTGWTPAAVEPLPDIDDPPWHAHPALQLSLWTLFVGAFSATCASPLLRRLFRRSGDGRQLDPAIHRARRLAVLVSAAYVTVAAGLVGVSAQFAAGEPRPWLWTALRGVALCSVVMTLGLVVTTARARSGDWPRAAHLPHLGVTLAAAAFVPFLAYWRLVA